MYMYDISMSLILRNAMLQTVSITMDVVNLEAKHTGGCSDYVSLYNGPSVSSSMIGVYCATPVHSTVVSSSSSVLVVFVSDGSVKTGRFSLSWTFAG